MTLKGGGVTVGANRVNWINGNRKWYKTGLDVDAVCVFRAHEPSISEQCLHTHSYTPAPRASR